VEPLVDLGDFVPKGMQIATVANLATGPHLHFGLRIGSYDAAYLNGTPFAGTGGLPQNNCQDSNGAWYPAFSSSGFISPESTGNILFQ
jgi:murein DD-endopeptidase MepM/ murein hydrolase activator NlpD